MPNGNGMDLLKHVNTMANRPIFYFVSGQADISIEEGLKLGAKRFFAKPFDIDELMTEVKGNFSSSFLIAIANCLSLIALLF